MNKHEEIRLKAREIGCVAVIPTYNNAGTLADVVRRVKRHVADVIVVNDGSTDDTSAILDTLEGVEIMSYQKNRGKGHALRLGIAAAHKKGFRYALTIDSDGQHFPEDIELFLAEAAKNPDCLVIGARNLTQENMPSKNTFANRFSNFWFRLETGKKMDDTQSGFRLYPLEPLSKMRFMTSRYEFELESAVKLAWKGVRVVNIPIRVFYAPDGERISHFKPVRDFTRISILNTWFVLAALVWYYPAMFLRWLSWRNIKAFFRDNITHSGESNLRIASAIGWGAMWGVMPVWGYQMILAGVSAHLLRLNKVITIAAANISIPPMIPLILWGSFVTGGLLLGRPTGFSLGDITFESIAGGLVQYIVGAVVLAVATGAMFWLVSYIVLKITRKEPANG